MPNAAWVQGRVRRMMRQTYTRTPRVEATTEDSWGNPETTLAAPVPDAPCLFLDTGTVVNGGNGPIQIESETLCIPFDDPLSVGDLVSNIVDPETGFVLYQGPAKAQLFTEIASHGARIYRFVKLIKAEAE